ncbi:MAG: hypothetical protein ABW051_05805 [Burkholderiaceae bacterium]
MTLGRRFVFAGLLFAFLAMQTLGFMHRVEHGPAHGLGAAVAAVAHEAAHAHSDDHGHAGPGLFSSHDDGSPSCQVYDQLSHADFVAPAGACALPSVPPSFRILFFQGEAVARWATLFDARGPPPVL